jgi:hypothetical protein
MGVQCPVSRVSCQASEGVRCQGVSIRASVSESRADGVQCPEQSVQSPESPGFRPWVPGIPGFQFHDLLIVYSLWVSRIRPEF